MRKVHKKKRVASIVRLRRIVARKSLEHAKEQEERRGLELLTAMDELTLATLRYSEDEWGSGGKKLKRIQREFDIRATLYRIALNKLEWEKRQRIAKK